MAYGLATFRPDGSALLTGLSRPGVLVGVIVAPAGTSGITDYPTVSSASSLQFSVVRSGGHTVSAINHLGNGAIQWSVAIGKPQTDTVIFVYAKLVTSDPYGLQLTNDAGETLADAGVPSPQYVGAVTLSATANYSYTTPDGYNVHLYITPNLNLRSGSNQLVVMNLPDSGTNDTWYEIDRSYVLASEGTVTTRLRVFTKASSFQVPSLHVYAMSNPVSSGDPYALRLYTAAGALTFDSSAETLSSTTSQGVGAPAYGSSSTYDLALSSNVGIPVPYYYKSAYTTTGGDTRDALRYAGAVKRVGTQLTWTSLYESRVTTNVNQPDYVYGPDSSTPQFTQVADLSALSPSLVTGAAASSTSSYPSFTTQPRDVSGPYGTALTLTSAAIGAPTPTYQWYRGSSPISGATSANYTFTPASGDDLATFYCVATNALGSAMTRVATFYLDTSSGPTITSSSPQMSAVHPHNYVTVAGGTSTTVTFSAAGSPTPACKLLLGSTVVATGTGSATYTFTTVAGTTYNFTANATITAEHLVHVDEQYVDVISPSSTTQPATITASPASQTVAVGSTVSFSASMSGDTPLYYRWYKNGQGGVIPSSNGSVSTSPSTVTVSFSTTLADDGAVIRCDASNYPVGESYQYTSSSANATLTVTSTTGPNTPVFSQQPSNVSTTQSATVTLTATASPVTSYDWYRNGVLFGSGQTINPDTGIVGSFTYFCIANNGGAANSARSNSVTVTVSSGGSSAPTITSQPSNVSVTQNGSATFSVAASGATGYQWYRNGGAIGGATSSTVSADTSAIGSFSYYCVVSNTYGTTNSATATLTVTGAADTTPVISSQPSSVSVAQGGSASFSITASPATGYQWYRDGGTITGATSSSVSADTSTVGSFSYTCVVTNGTASVTSSAATLTVSAPSSSTYPSYNNFGGEVDDWYGNPVEFDIYSSGGSSTGPWANGTGDGTLYEVMASGSFTPAYGSFALNTWYDFATYSGVSWILPSPASASPGALRSASITVSVRIKSTGSTVASSSITLLTQRNDGVPP